MPRKIIFHFPEEEPNWGSPRPRFRRSLIAGAAVVGSALVAFAVFSFGPMKDATTSTVSAEPSDTSSEVVPSKHFPTEYTIVHNGVTVVSPRLLVPILPSGSLEDLSAAKPAEEQANKSRVTHRRTRLAKEAPLSAPWFNNTKRVARF